jgi:hypothetical protein
LQPRARHAAIFLAIASALVAGEVLLLSPLESGIVAELNKLRLKPPAYAAVLAARRPYYDGKFLRVPGHMDMLTEEGVRPLDDAVKLLETMHGDVGQLTASSGLSRAAADQVHDTGAAGAVGHQGSDGSTFAKRIARYGKWSGDVAESITFGGETPEDVVAQMLVDDGVDGRGHRYAALDTRWRFVGVACGPHAQYKTMCVLDFASDFKERSGAK